jgi:hypothetical protein
MGNKISRKLTSEGDDGGSVANGRMGMAALWGAVHRTHTRATCRLLARLGHIRMSALTTAFRGKADSLCSR